MRILTQSSSLSPLRRVLLMTQSQPRMSLSSPLSTVITDSRSTTPPPTLSTESSNTPKRRRIHSPSSGIMSTPKIELNEQEETVRRLLVDVGAEIDTYNRTTGATNKEPVILRFTGGWVRDKLLGIPSHDIDVGINRMTGYHFGLYLVDFLERHYHSYGIEAGTVHKIDSNPERSKHLETATMKILGLDIDLVNLRTEVYKGDTRIPQMEFGTPVQDALRRDCTVNALFFNLHSQKVEDFTNRGLDDMKNKIIRTPLHPRETFEDDPLRILRLIRFSSRLGFEIVPEATEAMKYPEIKEALRIKISRERIGTEVEKMLKGNNPKAALKLIYSLGLYTEIFAPPTEDPTEIPPHPTHRMSIAISALSHIHSLPRESHPGIVSLTPTKHETYMSYLFAALTPWEGLYFNGPDKKKGIPAARTAAKEGLKANNKVLDIVTRGFNNVPIIREHMKLSDTWRRAQAGKMIRICGSEWRCHIICSLLLELANVWKEDADVPSAECEQIIKRYDRFVSKIIEFGAVMAYSTKSILSGKELLTVLGVQKPGPWLAVALAHVLEWQWDNPEKGKEEALEWAKGAKEFLAPGM